MERLTWMTLLSTFVSFNRKGFDQVKMIKCGFRLDEGCLTKGWREIKLLFFTFFVPVFSVAWKIPLKWELIFIYLFI